MLLCKEYVFSYSRGYNGWNFGDVFGLQEYNKSCYSLVVIIKGCRWRIALYLQIGQKPFFVPMHFCHFFSTKLSFFNHLVQNSAYRLTLPVFTKVSLCNLIDMHLLFNDPVFNPIFKLLYCQNNYNILLDSL